MKLSAGKSKIMVFEESKRKKEREWIRKKEMLVEVKNFKYLGYMLQKNGKEEKHMQERKRKATIAMKNVWNIGKRIFKDNFDRSNKLYRAIVESIKLFGAEIWG